MIPRIVCYVVCHLSTARQSCAHGAPTCCPIKK